VITQETAKNHGDNKDVFHAEQKLLIKNGRWKIEILGDEIVCGTCN
jgi:hypothetical protein